MILSLIFISLNFNLLFYTSFARIDAIHHSGYINENYGRSGRRLSTNDNNRISLEEHLQRLENLAIGYKSNSELEKAMKELNGRCSNISRIYRNVLGSVLGRVPSVFPCGSWKYLIFRVNKRRSLHSSILGMCMVMNQ